MTALPGVVDQHDLDAKAVNLLAAVGVAIALVLSIRAPWSEWALLLDPLRVLIGAVVWLVAVVWIAAVAGASSRETCCSVKRSGVAATVGPRLPCTSAITKAWTRRCW